VHYLKTSLETLPLLFKAEIVV